MTPAKEIDGELWIKADDHHWAVGEIEAEWQRRCEIIKQEASYWHKRYDAVMDSVMKTSFFHAHPPVTLMAEPQSFEAGRVMERKAMMQLFTDPENQPTQHGTVTVDYMQREIAAEREACAYRAGIALLGADRGLSNRVDQAIRARGQA